MGFRVGHKHHTVAGDELWWVGAQRLLLVEVGRQASAAAGHGEFTATWSNVKTYHNHLAGR